MPLPRSALVSLASTPYYHCFGRCVRRAFLCGEDHYSARSFEHPRGWIVEHLAVQPIVETFKVRYPVQYNMLYRNPLMDAISYTAARTNLAKTMEQVCEDHSPVIITRNKSQSVVMISLADYDALQETAYLLRAPKNARRLLESISELEQGGGQEKELLE